MVAPLGGRVEAVAHGLAGFWIELWLTDGEASQQSRGGVVLAKRWEARPRGAFYNADRERRAWHGVRVKSVGERAGPPGVACSVVVRAHGGVASGRVALGYDRWVRAGLAGGRHGTGTARFSFRSICCWLGLAPLAPGSVVGRLAVAKANDRA